MKPKGLRWRALRFIIPAVVITFLPFVALNYYVSYNNAASAYGEVSRDVDESEAKAAAARTALIASAIPIAWLCIMIIGILAFTRYLRRIATEVSDFADKAASGDLTNRLPASENDAFGQMEQHLNAMISSMGEMNKRSTEHLNAAEFANRSKSDFLSRMSHEIRSPMNAIIGMTQIAKSSSNVEKMHDCLMKIDNASKHLLALINDVLDMSKIEANKFELTLEEFSLDRTLNKIFDMMNVKAEEKKQSLSLVIDKKLPEHVVSDELRFSQVITNLVSNAVKFTGEGGKIDIHVRMSASDGDEYTLRVDVKDTGIGLSPDQIGKLFRPFEQGDGSISRRFGGTGLGLAINKRIIEMMKGEITVESAPDKGSTFSFTANVRKGTGSFAAAKREREHRLRTVQAKDMRILVVDDSEEANEYTSHILTTLGFKCDLARDGAEAVDMAMIATAKALPYDIIFMDYMMPKLDGIEAAKRIKELTGENVSIVMVSMYDWKEFEEKAREAGIIKCVSKPISPSTVLDSINEVMPTCLIKNQGVEVAPPSLGFSDNTILLVEDIDVNREIIAAFLEETHVKIDVAVNGVEAVKKFSEQPDKYDIVLMDIQMPEMDGFEATRRIRAMNTPKAKSIPIVAMTANALSEDVQKCKEAGMNDHMAKPVDPDTLMFKLNDFFFMKSYLGKDIY